MLVIDKPTGPTSHDVVAQMRRMLGERHIGHTGTLDPHASGVLPLVIGRATRLARFLAASDKAYEAVVELGSSTTTYDSEGQMVGAPYRGVWPTRADVELALLEFQGTFSQTPPRFSAKKIAGTRSYKTARAAAKRFELPKAAKVGASPAPALVSTHVLELLEVGPGRLRLRLECSAGFYVRSLAHDLGNRLGTGAYLGALRRTRSGDLTLDDAVALETAAADRATALAAITPTGKMLSGLPAVTVSDEGGQRVKRGQDIGPGDVEPASAAVLRTVAKACETDTAPPRYVRLLDAGGELVAIAAPSAKPGLLHPSVVLV